jgi:hypothetical protein
MLAVFPSPDPRSLLSVDKTHFYSQRIRSLEASAQSESRSSPARILSALLLSLFISSLGKLPSTGRLFLFFVFEFAGVGFAGGVLVFVELVEYCRLGSFGGCPVSTVLLLVVLTRTFLRRFRFGVITARLCWLVRERSSSSTCSPSPSSWLS